MPSITKIAITCLLATTLTACDGTWETDNVSKPAPSGTTASQTTTPAPAAQVAKTPDQIVLHKGDVSQNYTIIKDVKVTVNKTTAFHPAPTVAAVEKKLREAAAEIGGDAVTFVTITDVRVSTLSWGTRKGTGKVVKFDN